MGTAPDLFSKKLTTDEGQVLKFSVLLFSLLDISYNDCYTYTGSKLLSVAHMY
jgi:hypothetical protein